MRCGGSTKLKGCHGTSDTTWDATKIVKNDSVFTCSLSQRMVSTSLCLHAALWFLSFVARSHRTQSSDQRQWALGLHEVHGT